MIGIIKSDNLIVYLIYRLLFAADRIFTAIWYIIHSIVNENFS